MTEYTPTTDDVRRAYSPAVGTWADSRAAFDRWLAAHDAEMRASVLAEQGESEWEYGYGTGPAYWTAYDREHAEESRRPHERIVRRTKAAPAGPWLPVEEGEGQDQTGGEPTDMPTVRLSVRRDGKSQALIESVLAQTNERGIRVESVYPRDSAEVRETIRQTLRNAGEGEVFSDTAAGLITRALRITREGL